MFQKVWLLSRFIYTNHELPNKPNIKHIVSQIALHLGRVGSKKGERMRLRAMRALFLGKESVRFGLVTDANQKTAASFAAAYQPQLLFLPRHFSFLFFFFTPPPPHSPFPRLMNDRRKSSARQTQTGSENGA